MSYPPKRTLNEFDGTAETNVDTVPPKKTAWLEHQYDVNAVRSPQPQYDELSPPPVPPMPWDSQVYATQPTKYEGLPPKPTYDTLAPNYAPARAYEQPHPAPSTPWSAQQYDLNSSGRLPQPRYETVSPPSTPSHSPRHSPTPWNEAQYTLNPQGHHTPPISSDDYIQIATTVNEMELFRLRQDGIVSNPIYQGNPAQFIEMTSSSVQPKPPAQSYFQRFKSFVWSNAQRRIATLVITRLIIGGIIGAYFGISSSSTSASTTPSPDTRNCTYPEGVNATFTQLQETLNVGNSSLSIPRLDPATCSLISMVVNNTVSALKMGGYNCWQSVQSALMPLASSALALNMDSIQQIITSVKQYCFSSSTSSSTSSTAMTTSAPITSPANTVTTFTTTPTTSAPTTITTTTTTSGAGTTAITTSVAPSTTSTPTTTTASTTTVTTTITSTSPTTLRATTTSLVTTSIGTTTTLAPSTITSTSTVLAPTATTITVPPGTTTVTTLAPTTTTTVFVSSSTSSTIQTSTTAVLISTTKTTTLSSAATSTTTTNTATTTTLSCSSYAWNACPVHCSCCATGPFTPCVYSTSGDLKTCSCFTIQDTCYGLRCYTNYTVPASGCC